MGQVEDRLQNSIWHTTHPSRLASIMSEGLRPDPDIPEHQRWSTRFGPSAYSIVRSLGGVSLFDFRNFDQETYDRSHPMCNWRDFVPHLKSWPGVQNQLVPAAVWIEIDIDRHLENFIGKDELVEIWKSGNLSRKIMPRIECAVIGTIPPTSFKSSFISWENGKQIRDIEISPFSRDKYLRLLESL